MGWAARTCNMRRCAQTEGLRLELAGWPTVLRTHHSEPMPPRFPAHQGHKAGLAGHVQPLVGWGQLEAHHAAVHLGGWVVLATVDAEAASHDEEGRRREGQASEAECHTWGQRWMVLAAGRWHHTVGKLPSQPQAHRHGSSTYRTVHTAVQREGVHGWAAQLNADRQVPNATQATN